MRFWKHRGKKEHGDFSYLHLDIDDKSISVAIDTIVFKSTQDNYFKEFNGFKPNTIREITSPSEFKQFVDFMKQLSPDSKIRIHETKNGEETGMSFERYITDITAWKGYFIISWRHE